LLSTSLRAVRPARSCSFGLGVRSVFTDFDPRRDILQGSSLKGQYLKVPFIPQSQENDCGPAALASILAYQNHVLPLEMITAEVFTPALGRTLLPDMENFVRSLGLSPGHGTRRSRHARKANNAGDPGPPAPGYGTNDDQPGDTTSSSSAMLRVDFWSIPPTMHTISSPRKC
jgi:hypothetical protein